LETGTECAVWAAEDGPNLAMGSENLLALVPEDAMTTAEACQSYPVDAAGNYALIYHD
jgi:hypothetical protein